MSRNTIPFIPSKNLIEIVSKFAFEASVEEIIAVCHERLPKNEIPSAIWLRRYLDENFLYRKKLLLPTSKENAYTAIINNHVDLPIKKVREILMNKLANTDVPSASTIRRYVIARKSLCTQDNNTISDFEQNDVLYFSPNEWRVFRSAVENAGIDARRPRLSDKDFLRALVIHYRDGVAWGSINLKSGNGERFYRRLVRWKESGTWTAIIHWIKFSDELRLYEVLVKSQ